MITDITLMTRTEQSWVFKFQTFFIVYFCYICYGFYDLSTSLRLIIFSILTESLNFGVDVSTLVQSSNCFEQNRIFFYSLWAQIFSPCSFAVYLTLYFDNNCPGNRVLKMDKNRTNHHNTNYFPSLFQLQTSQHKANDNIFHLQRIAKSFIFCIIFDSSRKKRMTWFPIPLKSD